MDRKKLKLIIGIAAIASAVISAILFIVTFAMQKLLRIIRAHVFIFVSIFVTLGDRYKNIFIF